MQVNPAIYQKFYVIYLLKEGEVNTFLWYCKYVDLLKLKDAMKNPAFEPNRDYTLEIIAWCKNLIDARNRIGVLLAEYKPWPYLNHTQDYNRIGSIQCQQTGEIFRSQADVIRRYNINPSQLTQHLKRAVGYQSIKGMTFTRAAYLGRNREPIKLAENEPTKHYIPKHNGKRIRCNETGQEFKNQKQAADLLSLNSGQLSQHLNGRTGFYKVKGLTFSYLPPTEPAPPVPFSVTYPPARQV